MNCAAIYEETRNDYVTNYYGTYKLLTEIVQKIPTNQWQYATTVAGNTLKRNSCVTELNPNGLLLKKNGTDKKINGMK